jgi:hypothetical protein
MSARSAEVIAWSICVNDGPSRVQIGIHQGETASWMTSAYRSSFATGLVDISARGFSECLAAVCCISYFWCFILQKVDKYHLP